MASPIDLAMRELPPASYEVLCALLLGLTLRANGDEWIFVGPWQQADSSKVDPRIASALLAYKCVRLSDDGSVCITETGRACLGRATTSAIFAVTKWFRETD
jgi:hypothetical protein